MKSRVFEIEVEEVVRHIHKITVEVAPCGDIEDICDAIDGANSIDELSPAIHSSGGAVKYLTEDEGTSEFEVLSYEVV